MTFLVWNLEEMEISVWARTTLIITVLGSDPFWHLISWLLAGARASCIARSLAAIVLIMQIDRKHSIYRCHFSLEEIGMISAVFLYLSDMRVFQSFPDFQIFWDIKNPEIITNYAEFSYF